MNPDLNARVRTLVTAGDEAGTITLLRKEERLSLHAARERVSSLTRKVTEPEPQDAAYIFTSIGGFVLLCVVALSGYLSLSSAIKLYDYWNSANWPTTTGIITHSQPDNVAGPGVVMGPRVEYDFSVNGENYLSSRWGLPLVDAGPGSNISGVLTRFPSGAEVVVYYDPEQPQRALLDTSLQGPWIRLMAFVISMPVYLWYRRFARRIEAHSRQKLRQ